MDKHMSEYYSDTEKTLKVMREKKKARKSKGDSSNGDPNFKPNKRGGK